MALPKKDSATKNAMTEEMRRSADGPGDFWATSMIGDGRHCFICGAKVNDEGKRAGMDNGR